MRIQLNFWYLLVFVFYFSLLVSTFSLLFLLSISFDEYRCIFVSMRCLFHDLSYRWAVHSVSCRIDEFFRWVVIDPMHLINYFFYTKAWNLVVLNFKWVWPSDLRCSWKICKILIRLAVHWMISVIWFYQYLHFFELCGL